MQNVPIRINFKGRTITGVADPVDTSTEDGVPRTLIIYLHGKFLGTLECSSEGWRLDRPTDPDLVETIGDYLQAWYE